MTRIFQKSVYLTVFISFFTHSLFSQTNPLSPASGFDLFLEGNFTITQGDIEGAIAVGGNMTVLGNAQRTSANATGGISYVNLSGANYALIVNGSLIGTNGFNFKIDPKAGGSTTNHFARFGTISPSTVAASSGGIDIGNPPTDPTKRYVRINSTSQTASSVQNSTALVNFATAFSSLRSTSASLAACTGNVTPSVSGGQATLNLGANSPNVWNIAGATLNTYSQINLTGNLPSALKPLIINVSGSGTFNWSNVKFVMGTESDNFMEINRAPYIIWNFKDVTNLNIQNSNLILGSILAPNAVLTNNGTGNITGQVIAQSFNKPQAGELHIAKFNTTFNSCGATCTNPTVSINGTSDICSGSSTTLTATASGGSGYTYLWSTGATTSSISVAPAAHTTYTVTVTVTGGCSSSATKQVNVFDAKWDNVTVNATCNKLLVDANFAATGNFVVSYTYGGQTYTEPSTGSFSSAAAFELTGQGAGIYSNITIKRASSPVCTAVWPESMTVYPSCDVFSCPGNLLVNPSFENGITGWDFSGGNLSAANYAAVFGLNAGHFQITNGSSNWASQVLPGTYTGGSKIDLSVYAGTHNPSGFYHSVGFDYFDTNWNYKGSQQVEVNSQLPTMTQYVLTGTVQSTNGNTPPANNTYYVTARANGTGDWIKMDGWCVVPQVTSCNVSISGDDNVCVGDSVFLTATSTSGTPVSYSWSNGGTSSTKRVGPTTNTTYTVTATFSNGCTATASKTITVSHPPAITECEVRINNTWSVLSNCIAAVNIGDNVMLSVNPNTFPSGYTQVWEGPNGFTATSNDALISSSITAAQEGNYTFIVSNGICTISQNIYISVNQTDDCSCLSGNLVTNGNFTNNFTGWSGTSYDDAGVTSCSDGINKAFVSNSTGAEAVLFQEITTGVTANTKFTYSFMAGTHSPSGTHKARVKFYNSSGTLLATPLNLEIDKDVDFPSSSWCLNLQAYGPYEFTTPANTAKIRLEFVEVTTGQGYIKVANVELQKCNAAPILTLVGNNPLCNGLKGSVSFTTSGGTGTKTVRLNGNIVTSPVTNLAAGTYVFTVTDASACSSTKSVTITQPTAITATTTKVDGTCVAPNSGSINLTVSGGTPNYTFSWSNGATTEDLANLTAGTYTVTVTDANGCTATSSAVISTPPKYTIGDLVWLDVNADGVQNGGAEVGISDVTVTLYKASNNTQVDQTTTNGSGIYSFLVCPDTYYIIFGTKSGYNRTTSTGLVTVTTNSDASVVDGKTSNFTVTSSNINYVDAGLTQIAALGDRVWLDNGQGGGTANDGLQNGTEPGVVGVTVNLYKDLNNDGDVLDAGETTPFATMLTGANGIYNFIGLTPGNYQVGIVVPSGYDNTIQTNATNDGANDATGSDFVPATDRSYIVVLAFGETENDIDAGLVGTAALGDRVWLDNGDGGGTANDGLQNGTEPGVVGVTVNLYKDLNNDGDVLDAGETTPFATMMTGANGIYNFTGLTPGNYQVGIVVPSGYDNSAQTNSTNDGANDAIGSDFVPATDRSYIVVLGAGETENDIDAGLVGTAALGDRVWLDNGEGAGTANDGLQNGTEPGVVGVTVNLYKDLNNDGDILDAGETTPFATMMTGANGIYNFTGLTPGNYQVGIVVPSGYDNTLQTNTTNDGANDATGSDFVPATDRSYIVVLGAGETENDIDAGLVGTAALGDRVWLDNGDGGGTANDGLQNGTEPGVVGVTVNLYKDLNNDGDVLDAGETTPFATMMTGANGIYNFTGLTPGNYQVGIVVPSGYDNSAQTNSTNDGANDAIGSDFVPATDRSYIVVLGAGETENDIDAGLVGTAALGDRVWLDNGEGAGTANDGLQNGTEPGVVGVTVNLYKDLNNDGDILDAGETTPFATMMTGANGIYNFTGLTPGNYQVGIVVPSGYDNTLQTNTTNDGANDATGSDFVPATDRSYIVVLGAGETENDIDAGLVGTAALGDRVWLDNGEGAGTANDGLQNGTEPGVVGVTVNLYKDLNNDGDILDAGETTPFATMMTGANGIYNFTGLTPGNYQVGIVVPSGYDNSAQTNTTNDGANDATGSDFVPATDRSYIVVLGAGETENDIDAGLIGTAALGDRVWLDNGQGGGTPNDGLQNGTEPGVVGVTVNLYKDLNNDGDVLDAGETTPFATMLTGANGIYNFTGLTPGNYQVGIVVPSGYDNSAQTNTTNDGANDATGSDFVPATDRSYIVVLGAGETENDIDAGLIGNSSLGDKVWLDLDADGIQDGNETTGVNGVTVKLYADNNTDGTPDGASIALTTTSGNGDYSFTNLVPGNYIVEFTKPAGYTSSPQNNTVGDDPTDSDANTTTGRTGTINLVNGENDPTNDAGLYQFASIGDTIWFDANANGLQDIGEVGIAGVQVTLLNGITMNPITTDGLGNTISPITTGTDGKYLFTNLIPGTYKVQFGTASGYARTTANAGNDAKDSDADLTNGTTGSYVLAQGDMNMTVDAGYIQCPDTVKRTDNLCFNFTFNLNNVVPGQYVGGTWFNLNGAPVANPGAVNAGEYHYVFAIGNGCEYVIEQEVILTIPDYTANIILTPNNIQGARNVRAVITISEINLVENCRQIIVRVPVFQDRYNFTWDSGFNGTVVPGVSANNTEWEYLGIASSFHRWRYIGNGGTFEAGSQARFVFQGLYNPLGSDGFTSFNVAVNNGSGGETNFANNAASQILTFRK